jgi:hypothetical protein
LAKRYSIVGRSRSGAIACGECTLPSECPQTFLRVD